MVDDNEIARLGIESLLASQRDFEVVAQARNGAEAVSLYAQFNPDVVLCDLKLPDIDGDKVTSTVLQTHPEARFIILTNYDREEDVFRATQAGAVGYLTKESPGAEVVAALRKVVGGETHFPPTIAAKLAERDRRSAFNARELHVLSHIAKGAKNQEIAAALGLSVKGVEMYVTRILDKLDAKTRTEAVATARQRGVL